MEQPYTIRSLKHFDFVSNSWTKRAYVVGRIDELCQSRPLQKRIEALHHKGGTPVQNLGQLKLAGELDDLLRQIQSSLAQLRRNAKVDQVELFLHPENAAIDSSLLTELEDSSKQFLDRGSLFVDKESVQSLVASSLAVLKAARSAGERHSLPSLVTKAYDKVVAARGRSVIFNPRAETGAKPVLVSSKDDVMHVLDGALLCRDQMFGSSFRGPRNVDMKQPWAFRTILSVTGLRKLSDAPYLLSGIREAIGSGCELTTQLQILEHIRYFDSILETLEKCLGKLQTAGKTLDRTILTELEAHSLKLKEQTVFRDNKLVSAIAEQSLAVVRHIHSTDWLPGVPLSSLISRASDQVLAARRRPVDINQKTGPEAQQMVVQTARQVDDILAGETNSVDVWKLKIVMEVQRIERISDAPDLLKALEKSSLLGYDVMGIEMLRKEDRAFKLADEAEACLDRLLVEIDLPAAALESISQQSEKLYTIAYEQANTVPNHMVQDIMQFANLLSELVSYCSSVARPDAEKMSDRTKDVLFYIKLMKGDLDCCS